MVYRLRVLKVIYESMVEISTDGKRFKAMMAITIKVGARSLQTYKTDHWITKFTGRNKYRKKVLANDPLWTEPFEVSISKTVDDPVMYRFVCTQEGISEIKKQIHRTK